MESSADFKLVGLVVSEDCLSSSSNESLNLSLVGGVSYEIGKFALHIFVAQFLDYVVLFPELFLVGLSGLSVNLDVVKTKLFHNSKSGLVAWVLFEMRELTESSV